MTSLFSKALVYLGLVDEEASLAEGEPDDDAPGADHRMNEITGAGRRVEPPAASSRTVAPGPAVRSIRSEAQADILVVEEFGDARILADRIRDRVPVVLDFRQADGELVRRVVDFSSGLIYALDGTMNKVGEGLVLVLPPSVSIDEVEKRRLASLGAYELES